MHEPRLSACTSHAYQHARATPISMHERRLSACTSHAYQHACATPISMHDPRLSACMSHVYQHARATPILPASLKTYAQGLRGCSNVICVCVISGVISRQSEYYLWTTPTHTYTPCRLNRSSTTPKEVTSFLLDTVPSIMKRLRALFGFRANAAQSPNEVRQRLAWYSGFICCVCITTGSSIL